MNTIANKTHEPKSQSAAIKQSPKIEGKFALPLIDNRATSVAQAKRLEKQVPVNPVLQRVFDPSLDIATVEHFAGQFAEQLKGFKFSEKSTLFNDIKKSGEVYNRENIIAWLEAKKKPEAPAVGVAVPFAVPPPAAVTHALKGKTMARMEHPVWADIEPLLAGYGIITDTDKEKVKNKIVSTEADPRILIRGIPDLIEKATGVQASTTAANIRATNAAAAPDITVHHQTVTVGRGDTRRPDVIKQQGGLYGWDPGVVTIEHARAIVNKVSAMAPEAQKAWANAWKRPTPPPEERNPWVATGKGDAQKNADSVYVSTIPLKFTPIGGHGMHVGTDTGSVGTANVIGVQLDPQGNGAGDEILVLTGIPWKYISTWNGEDKDVAAAAEAAKH
ncbi:hypothetical protein [Mucilaginibacter celer]|uniref:Uncharacterized protein n=1 Tax=Mucilaginibacter celer TaxID=2305508 RepID=A0A494VQW8_9SPHI|nr:hypothetical protein [Mucilaginibacter celer]AYL97986.1 hypothetical protein HYN43_023025 [Mucilaginibacter celer]